VCVCVCVCVCARAGARIQADINPYAVMVYEADGVTKLEAMQSHRNNEIYSRAMAIINEFFEGEDGNDAATPTVDSTGALQV
jgi:importin subunit alpha-1